MRAPGRRPTAEALAAAAADALAGAERISAHARALTPAAGVPPLPVQELLERRWLLITTVSAALVMMAVALFLAFDTPARPPGGGGSPGDGSTVGPGSSGGSGTSADGSGGSGSSGRSGQAGQVDAGSGVHHIDVVSGRASVRVNGRTLGDTPVDYVGTVGETVSVELRQDGFVPVREDIQVTTTGTSTFNMVRAARNER
jgi:hypothetical protein